MARSTIDRSARPERHGLAGCLYGRLAPALVCAIALYGTPDPARAEDPEQPPERPTLTADEFLDQLEATEPGAPAPLSSLREVGLDESKLLPPLGTGVGLASDFWRLRSSLEPRWDAAGARARKAYLLHGSAFDVGYLVRFDKRQRFDLMASWGLLSLGLGKAHGAFTGFGGVMLPLDSRNSTLRLGAEVGKKGPRMMLGVDIPLGGPD